MTIDGKNPDLSPTSDLPTLLATVDEAAESARLLDQEIRVNFLRNFSIETIEPFLQYHLYESKINPKVTFGNFDNVDQEILDPQSHLYRDEPEIVVLSLQPDKLVPEPTQLDWKLEDT